MPLDLSDTLVVGISATALFDLKESDALFQETSKSDPDNAIEIYRNYMMETEDIPLNHGTGFPLVNALLNLNQYQKENEPPLVEVVIMSKNSPDTGIRILKSIRHHKVAITRSAFTAGESVVDYLEAFDVDLFLTTSIKDAQRVIDSRFCAAAVVKNPPEGISNMPDNQVRLAFDGDAVIFDDSSEIVYKTMGLSEFHKQENDNHDIPLAEGPYATFLKKLSRLQDRLPMRVEYSPVRIALVTARNSPAELRVIKTLRHWGVYVDEAFFLGGVEKSKVLKAFKPHIFFDDQEIHLEAAAKSVPSGRVPYASESPLNTPSDE
ncbi:5'-nucleotidase [Desulfomicrobium sp. ZS1]|uniref:5'-nucleotidase n=1 Tax=Desulfomicrobium sp. ZS1 TaxID=2952228 RepID=UPI0020B1FA3F|nr:5'-nucleotidase [Desulfomicrobium sp. ZS1]UTF51792.1 5'-nucleotidase [Desulfomicrobium sp. ZS1]